MTDGTKNIIKFVAFTLIILILMYVAFKDVNFEELVNNLQNANYFIAILASLIGVLGGGVIRAYRWKYFIEPIKKHVKFKNLFSSMMIGYMMNSILPKSGEVSRPVVFAKQEDISRAAAFGTIVAERIFDMLSLFVSFGFCLFYFRDSIFDAFGNDFEQYALWGSIAVMAGVLIIIVMILNIEKTELFIEKYITRFLPAKIQGKVKEILVSMINGFLFIKYPKNYLIIFILSVLLWLSYALSTYVLFFAFGIDLNFLDANLLLTIITFTLVLPLPGNSFGAFHVVCTTVLVSIYHLNRELALSYATVSHLLNFVFLVAIGFYYSIKENIKINLKYDKVETT